jgi:hypothetical protein
MGKDEKPGLFGKLPAMDSWERLILTAWLGLTGIDIGTRNDVTQTLQGIESSLHELAKSVAVAVQRLEDHDKRISSIENFILERGKRR